MPVYRIADLNIHLTPETEFFRDTISEYLTEEEQFDLQIRPTKEEILKEREISGVNHRGLCESTAVLRKLCHSILQDFNGIFLHSATIIYEGKAYAFIAPSGTGKTTHIMLWKKLYGEKVTILNGDKLLIRFVDGIPVAYGNPWRGKEKYGINGQCRLCGLFILQRGEVNSLESIEPQKALPYLLNATVFPKSDNNRNKVFDRLEQLLSAVNLHVLKCNMETDAVYTAQKGIDED